MDAAADRPTQARLLASIEAEFFALRRRPPDLAAAFANAYAHATGNPADALACSLGHKRVSDDPLWRQGQRLVAFVDAANRDDALAYHNRHHVAEAVLAMGWLCGVARRMGVISPTEGVRGVIAMVGHDLLHDGTPPGGGELEARAADAVIDALQATGRDRATLRAVILGTDPYLVAENAARAAGDLPASRLGNGVDTLCALANEADVFASLLPDLGEHLTECLALEWRRGGHARADEVESYASRLAFLTSYLRLTPWAAALGIGDLLARQIRAFECIDCPAHSGAAALDALPMPEARRRYHSALCRTGASYARM